MQCSAVIPDASRHLSRFGKKKRNVCCNSFSLGAGGRPCGCLFSLSLPAHVYIRSGGLFLSLSVCVCRRRYIWISCVKQLESIYLLRRISLSFAEEQPNISADALLTGALTRSCQSNHKLKREDLAAQQEKKRRLRLKRYNIQLHTLSYSCEGSFFFLFTTIWFSFLFFLKSLDFLQLQFSSVFFYSLGFCCFSNEKKFFFLILEGLFFFFKDRVQSWRVNKKGCVGWCWGDANKNVFCCWFPVERIRKWFHHQVGGLSFCPQSHCVGILNDFCLPLWLDLTNKRRRKRLLGTLMSCAYQSISIFLCVPTRVRAAAAPPPKKKCVMFRRIFI